MTLGNFDRLWVYLAGSPLMSLLATLVAFIMATHLHRLLKGSPFAHPVLGAIALLIVFLLVTDIDYATYFEGAQFIHFLLGPATVALAIPLFDHRERVRRLLLPILLACLTGIFTAVTTTLGAGWLLGAQPETLLSLAPRSVTSPIAMGIAEEIGGIPALAAALVLLTGAIGCAVAPPLFRWLKVKDPTVQGFTLGLAAHGFGTAQSFASLGALAGAFAGLAMGLTGLLTAFVLPLIVALLGF